MATSGAQWKKNPRSGKRYAVLGGKVMGKHQGVKVEGLTPVAGSKNAPKEPALSAEEAKILADTQRVLKRQTVPRLERSLAAIASPASRLATGADMSPLLRDKLVGAVRSQLESLRSRGPVLIQRIQIRAGRGYANAPDRRTDRRAFERWKNTTEGQAATRNYARLKKREERVKRILGLTVW